MANFVNFFKTRVKSVMIPLILLVIVIVVVGVVLGLKESGQLDKLLNNAPAEEEETVEEVEDIEEPSPEKKQVYNISNNLFDYEQAKHVCEAYGGDLASLDQMLEAHREGADWCNYGWSKDQMALFPTQEETFNKLEADPKTRGTCGVPGVNGGYFKNAGMKFGVNCYGVKPEKKMTPMERLLHEQNALNPLSNNAQQYMSKLDDFTVNPFSQAKWSRYQEDPRN